MAILSAKVNLSTTWTKIGNAMGFVGEAEVQTDGAKVEVVNADTLPVGTVDGAMTIDTTTTLRYPQPALGSLYVRVSSGTGVLKYYGA